MVQILQTDRGKNSRTFHLVDSKGSFSFSPRIGAEARVEMISWYGLLAIRKIRISKSYRNSQLDGKLRAQRTREEVQILHSAKLAGVACPRVYFADPVRAEIIMEYVEGTVLKELTVRGKRINQKSDLIKIYEILGQRAGRLHAKNIIHGDLTTKNILISGPPIRLTLLDFGLSFVSERIEDKAEDLHLLKQALISTTRSLDYARKLFGSFTKGYSREVSGKITAAILKQMSQIETRGRYARVE